MEITVWRHALAYPQGQLPPPDVKIFNKTITDLGLVHDTQDQLDGSELSGPIDGGGGCTTGDTTYIYEFRFATLEVPTQIYDGYSICVVWDVTLFGVPDSGFFEVGVSHITLDGANIMATLHKQTGMPLPPGGFVGQ